MQKCLAKILFQIIQIVQKKRNNRLFWREERKNMKFGLLFWWLEHLAWVLL